MTIRGTDFRKFTQTFDGLFHDKVMVCERDADCIFYGAITDVISESDRQRLRSDLMFIHTGGKHRIPMVVRSLKALDVPTMIITDFDVLREEQPLRGMIEAVGGAWTDIDPYWKALKRDVEHRSPEVSRQNTVSKIQEVLEKAGGDIISQTESSEIKRILRHVCHWDAPKEHGVSFFKGESHKAAFRLLEKCSELGVFIVPVGELEGFDRRSGNHGSGWVNDVLQRDLANDPQLAQAREFVSLLVKSGPM